MIKTNDPMNRCLGSDALPVGNGIGAGIAGPSVTVLA